MAEQHAIIHDFAPFTMAVEKAVEKHARGYVGDIKMMMQYGFRQDRDIIPNLIIDDGDPKRTRRNIVLDQKQRFVGISVHEHFQFDYIALFLFADEVGESNNCSCQIM